MRFRPGTTGDVAQLVDLATGFHALHREIAPDDYCVGLDRPAAATMFAEMVHSAEFVLIVADPGEAPLAGYVWGHFFDRPQTPFCPAARFLFLAQMFVAPAARRRNVASSLLAYARAVGAVRGASELMLDVVISNAPAVAAFAANGFRSSAVIMRRHVA
jgi:GNAT superfamily N-acetyltransferase